MLQSLSSTILVSGGKKIKNTENLISHYPISGNVGSYIPAKCGSDNFVSPHLVPPKPSAHRLSMDDWFAIDFYQMKLRTRQR